jgi:hypothetical protein
MCVFLVVLMAVVGWGVVRVGDGHCDDGLLNVLLLALVNVFLKCYCCLSFCFSCLCDSKNTYKTASMKYGYVHHLCESKKTTYMPTSGNHFDFVTYVSWQRKLDMRPQVFISFLFFYCISQNTPCRTTNVQYNSFSSPMWVEKTAFKLASVQNHFFHLLHE